LFILGAIAVIMIVIGGIRYTTSNGDSGSIKSAKDTILYAVVGLVVAMLAYAIVNFVVQSF
jgi:multisubunit Na+/H+ antiporter MnhB subunit